MLTAHEGGIRSSELAALLHLAPRSATEVIDALESKGLVARSPDPTDRRNWGARPTEPFAYPADPGLYPVVESPPPPPPSPQN